MTKLQQDKTTTKTFPENQSYLYTVLIKTEKEYIYNNITSLPLQGGKNQHYDQNVEVNNMHDVLQRYQQFLCGEHTKTRTIRQYMTGARQFIQHTKGIIDTTTMNNYKQHLNQHYKNNSIRIRLHGANKLLQYLGHTERYKLPHEQQTNQHTITEQQIDQLLKITQINPELHLILLLLWDGCLRNQSIIDLKTNDRQENRLQLNNTKTGDRHIIMSQALQTAWTNYLIHRPTPKPQHSDYLLIRTNGEHYKDIYHITESIRRLGIITGISHPVTPYTIRRTSATLRQNKFSRYYAGDPKIVQMMFNHTDIKTTMRYNQKTDNDIEQYLDTIIYHDDIRDKTHDKSYLPIETHIKQCCENQDNSSVMVSYTLIFFGGDFLEKIGTRPAEQLFPLCRISLEDKDWDGIDHWMRMQHERDILHKM